MPHWTTHVMRISHWFHIFLSCYLNNTCNYFLLIVTSLWIVWFVCLQYVQNMLVLTSFVNEVIMVNYFGIISWIYPSALGMLSSYVIVIFLCCYKVAINIHVVAIFRFDCNLDLKIIIKNLLVVFVCRLLANFIKCSGRCVKGWANLPQIQNPYLFKILIKNWKLQLVYIEFLHIFSISLMSHLEFIFP